MVMVECFNPRSPIQFPIPSPHEAITNLTIPSYPTTLTSPISPQMNANMYLGGDDLASMGLSFQKPSSVKSRTHVCHGNVTSPAHPVLDIFLTARP